jgi:hypothetical protein
VIFEVFGLFGGLTAAHPEGSVHDSKTQSRPVRARQRWFNVCFRLPFARESAATPAGRGSEFFQALLLTVFRAKRGWTFRNLGARAASSTWTNSRPIAEKDGGGLLLANLYGFVGDFAACVANRVL